MTFHIIKQDLVFVFV